MTLARLSALALYASSVSSASIASRIAAIAGLRKLCFAIQCIGMLTPLSADRISPSILSMSPGGTRTVQESGDDSVLGLDHLAKGYGAA
jgi:hypothetical protein